MSVEWRQVVGFEGFFEVSDSGLVRSTSGIVKAIRYGRPFQRMRVGKLISLVVWGTGYFHVTLCVNKKSTMHYVHRLVAEAFIENHDNKKQVNHKNGIRTDNHVENLEWATAKENTVHSRDVLSTFHCGSRSGASKLTESDIPAIRERRNAGENFSSIAESYGVRRGAIRAIIQGRTWKHV